MSEPRIISPLLDGFALGGSIYSHSGVNCYPAMQEDSDERYIVKTISIPASQTQLDALLLTGAFADEEAARGYFKELTQSLRNEVSLLDRLSQQKGFVPFLGYQVVPLAEGVGFEFYLVSPYRKTLARFLRRSSMTHLSAVNMGIDLCAALTAARQAGFLYVGLKPSNIFLGGEQEFNLGDLGFISLDSIGYTALPERCRSAYTPPEVADAFAALNTTMDTYALGLVLYQVYNDGKLPFDGEEGRKALMARLAEGEELPAPAYADYEMAQIILKACSYDPAKRWQDPEEMGQALITYMQRNGANNTLITIPEPVIIPSPAPREEPKEAPQADDSATDTEPETETNTAPETEAEAQPSQAAPAEDWVDRMDQLLSQEDEAEPDPDADTLRRILRDHDEEDVPAEDREVSDETAGILSQADELIAQEVPEPVVAPEPIEIPMPAPIVTQEQAPEAQAEPAEDEPAEETNDEEAEKAAAAAAAAAAIREKRRKGRRKRIVKAVLRWVIGITVTALVCAGLYFGYNEYYLQEIRSLEVSGEKGSITVAVDTDLDQSKLTVVCTDLYGTKLTADLTDGTATFSNLTSGTQFNITLEVEGLHKLTGKTSTQYYTLPVATISEFQAMTGPDNGSVIVNFVCEGPAVKNWTLEYGADGEAPGTASFSGNTAVINGLTPGAAYTLTLKAADQVELTGTTQITHTASNVILAQDLQVLSNNAGSISVGWSAPEGVTVTGWSARCYNEAGFSQTLDVTEPAATFTGTDAASAYTVEILANGMTQSVRTYVTANPITVTKLDAAEFTGHSISVSWEWEGTAPENGWLVLYTVDGGTEQHLVQTDTTTAVIEPIAPGSRYDIAIQAANVTVFGGNITVETEEAGTFNKYALHANDITVTMCKAPAYEGWTYRDVPQADRINTFASGEKAGLILFTMDTYNIDYDYVVSTFAVRDADGKLVCVSSSTATWDDMWLAGHCDLSVPTMPTAAGSYTLELFFDGDLVDTVAFTIQ